MTFANKAIRYTLTGALAGALLAGTASAGSDPARDAARNAKAAQAAMVKGQTDSAVTHAEAAVTAAPQDAGMRALLGQVYLRAGRFESAALTLGEARQLGDAGARTALGLALAQVGSGHAGDAVALLDSARDVIGSDDLGLAYALAGESARGVAIMSDAIRAGEATPKQRQNLAYAYALDGRWREARIMMMQDVPADQIDARISDWASRARPEDAQLRVAKMLGAPMVTDAGRPDRLALNAAPAQQVAAAEAPAAEVAAAPAPAAELPAVADSDVPPSLAFAAAEPAPAPQPVAAPAVAEAPAAPGPSSPAATPACAAIA